MSNPVSSILLNVPLATAQPGAQGDPAEVIPWLILLIGIILVGGAVIYFVRRWMNSESGSATVGFTLHDLRDMHARGELTDDEFNNAKAAMVSRISAVKHRDQRLQKQMDTDRQSPQGEDVNP